MNEKPSSQFSLLTRLRRQPLGGEPHSAKWQPAADLRRPVPRCALLAEEAWVDEIGQGFQETLRLLRQVQRVGHRSERVSPVWLAALSETIEQIEQAAVALTQPMTRSMPTTPP